MDNCVVCGHSAFQLADRNVKDFEYNSPGTWDYYRCGNCGMLQISPFPTADDLAAAYPSTYHAYHEHTSPLAQYMKQRYWQKTAQKYASHLPGKDAAILDVGCASGSLLHEFSQLGYTDLTGIEYNLEAVEKGRAKGLTIHHGELEDVPLSPGTFDMIVIINFIEHVYDPAKTLDTLKSLLKPGGIIVGETPNTNAWDYRIFRKYWGGYHCPRHIVLFNDSSLTTLARNAGFRHVTITNMLQPAHWALGVQNYLQSSALNPSLHNGRDRFFPLWLLGFAPVNIIQALVSKTSLVEFSFAN